MQVNKFNFQYPASLENHLDSTANFWETITLPYLDKMIDDHMRLILEQTENAERAPGLQQALFALSDRISREPKFNTTEGRDLAFRVCCIAMGIYPSNGQKFDMANLPADILKLILSKNAPSVFEMPVESFFQELKFVSKDWDLKVNEMEKSWFEDENTIIPLRVSCNTAQEAILLIKEKNLKNVVLHGIPMTEADLSQLINTFPDLNQLWFNINNGIVNLPLEKLSKLKKLSIVKDGPDEECKFIESIKTLSQLESLIIHHIVEVELDAVVKAVKSLPKLKELFFPQSYIPGSELADALKNLPQLTDLQIASHHPEGKIPQNKLAEMLGSLPNLTKLGITQVIELPIDKHFENVLKNHLNLSELHVFKSTYKKEDIDKFKKEFPKIDLIIGYAK